MSYSFLDKSEVWSVLPNVLPPEWFKIDSDDSGGKFMRHDDLTVIVSLCREDDGKRWIHMSVSRPGRLPTWNDLRAAKNMFIGRERLAIQVLPRESEYVNVHPHVLHLWACLDGDAVPDFRKEGTL